MADLTAIILTMNEEPNIEPCIKSIKMLAARIIVIDSGSDDNTVSIAKSLGAEVYYHKFECYAAQFNWGLDNLGIVSKWVLRIDADERFTAELCMEAERACTEHKEDNINGFLVNQKVFFLNRWLMHGDVYPFQKLLIFKRGVGRIENRKMDEHTVLTEGHSLRLQYDAQHYAVKNIHDWIKKHNWYADRAIQDYFEMLDGKMSANLENGIRKRKRQQRSMYYKFPIFIRPFCLFVYRYIFRGGFLDGKSGFVYHIMLNFWYRELVDAKIYEHIVTGNDFAENQELR